MTRPAFPRPAAGRSATKRPKSGRSGPAQSAPDQSSPAQFTPAQSASDRSEEERTPLLCGIKPVLEMLESAPERIDAIFLRKGRHTPAVSAVMDGCRNAGIRFSLLDTEQFARLRAGNSQGVAARLYETGFTDLDDLLHMVMDAPLPLIIALDQVQDPGNAGALARTLYAMGGAGLIIPRHNGVYLGAAASRAGAGALEKLPVAKAGNLGQALDAARKSGFTVYGSAADATEADAATETANGKRAAEETGMPVADAFSFTPRFPAVLVLGGEEDGMRPGIRRRCDILLRIPMLRRFDSLNVAQAGGILISRFAESKLKKPSADPCRPQS